MLPRKHRVATRSFRSTQGTSRTFSVSSLTLRATKTGGTEPPQFAVIVSKKVAKTAVARNRIRRRVYGIIHSYILQLPNGFRFFLYPKQETLKASSGELRTACKELFALTGLL